jgi:hypothetical protein
VIGTELMLSLVGCDTDLAGGKLKHRNSFSKPNFEPLPKPYQVRQVHRMHRWSLGDSLFIKFPKISSGRVYEELLLERGPTPG